MAILEEKNWKVPAAIVSSAAIVVSSSLAVDSRYAHAEDIKDVIKNQESQINLLKRSQTQQQVFQLEYYDNHIRLLEREYNNQRNDQRRQELSKEIDAAKARRALIQRSIE